jgi:hypothetical protein
MSTEVSVGEATESDPEPSMQSEQGVMAEQLQQVYEYVLAGKQPEAVGATERLATQLNIEIERPD